MAQRHTQNDIQEVSVASHAPVGTPENPSQRVFTLANTITIIRLLLTFLFLFMFVYDVHRIWALVIYVIAAITDWLDGNIARATQTVSWFGKILDPIVDRALLFTGVLALVIHGELPLWVAMLLVIRDVALGLGAEYLKIYRKRPVDVVFVGKLATAFLMIGFSDLLLGWPTISGLGLVNVDWLPWINSESAAVGIIFVYLGLMFSISAAIVYYHKGFSYKREALAQHESTHAKLN